MRSTGMIMLIVIAAWFLNFVLSALGLVSALNSVSRSMPSTIAGLSFRPQMSNTCMSA